MCPPLRAPWSPSHLSVCLSVRRGTPRGAALRTSRLGARNAAGRWVPEAGGSGAGTPRSLPSAAAAAPAPPQPTRAAPAPRLLFPAAAEAQREAAGEPGPAPGDTIHTHSTGVAARRRAGLRFPPNAAGAPVSATRMCPSKLGLSLDPAAFTLVSSGSQEGRLPGTPILRVVGGAAVTNTP